MKFTVYLSGEIHTDWRKEIQEGVNQNNLRIDFIAPIIDHEASDSAGDHLGLEKNPFWRDHKSAKVNAIRTKSLIKRSDLAIVRFGEKYKQWGIAYEAGLCAALGIPYVTLHSKDIIHPLKEVDSTAMAWATTTAQVVEILKYVIKPT